LRANEFSLTPAGVTWKSDQTGATYPIAWSVVVPHLGIVLSASTRLPQQELTATSKLAQGYWEGAMEFSGKRDAAKIRGTGYLEMTGYDRPLQWTK
jgi:predicted secreted hydrolase